MKPEGTKNPTKKPYQAPRLRLYGDIQKITGTASMSMGADSGGHPNNKTA